MLRMAGSVLALGLLVGCAANIEALPSYIGVPGARVTTSHDEFTVHDRRRVERMMVVASTASSIGEDFDKGRAVDTTGPGTPSAFFTEAARAYLNQTGRSHCEIQSTSKVLNSQYEVAYECPNIRG